MSEPEHPSSSSRDAPGGKSLAVSKAGLTVRGLQLLHLLTRPMTLGVRGAAFDEDGRVFLVRHTYVPGWLFPGGGVDPGETAAEGCRRELREEGNLELDAEPELRGVHFNRTASRRDHVVFFLCRGARQSAPKRGDLEIAESGFFALDALPEGTTPATRRRLAEIASGARPDPFW